jgi:hypothetical protein
MNSKIWRSTIVGVIAAFAVAISVDYAVAQKLGDAQKAADKAQEEATKASDEAKTAQENADKAPKSDADKAAEKADQQAEKDEQAARDAQDTADASQAAKDAGESNSAQQAANDKAAADKANDQAQKSEDAAKKADEKADKGEDKDNPQKINRQKQKEKRKKAQEAWNKQRKLKQLKALTLGPTVPSGNSLAMLASTGQVKIDSAGTGETIGHIADLIVQNLTDQRLICAIPPMILESGSGKNQHYACPKGQTVALNPRQEKTVPMDGVCVNRSKPPVGKGVTGDLVINEGNPTIPQNPNSHVPPKDANKLLRLCTSKYDAADKLQKDGQLKDLPYKDKQKQKDIVTQWSTWCDPRISELTGAPPATKEDLKKVVYKQVPEPMTPETKKKIDKGIDTIFEKVELTTAKAKDLEKPDPFQNVKLTGEEGKGSTAEVSDQRGESTESPPPQTQEKPKEKTESPPSQTQEKPKEKFKWPKAVQDWLDKRKAAHNAFVAKQDALWHYNLVKEEFFRFKSKHWLELREKDRDAFNKAQTVGATQQDHAAHRDAVKELQKLEKELEKDFVQTPEGKEASGNVREAEKTAKQADDAAKEAGKNIPQESRNAILDSEKAQFEKDVKAAANNQPKTDEKPQEAAPKKP